MRPTEDKKDCDLKVRLNDDMRRHVERSSYGDGITMSEYLRNLIRADMLRK